MAFGELRIDRDAPDASASIRGRASAAGGGEFSPWAAEAKLPSFLERHAVRASGLQMMPIHSSLERAGRPELGTTSETVSDVTEIAGESAAKLAEARESAAQAAAIGAGSAEAALLASKRAIEKQKQKHATAPPLRQAGTVMLCRSPAMCCDGCGQGFIVNEDRMMAVGGGLVHAYKTRCIELARMKLADKVKEASENKRASKVDTVELQSKKKEVQLAHKFSEARMEMIARCLRGECGEHDEPRMMCVEGCGRGLHAKACAQVSKARRTMGLFKCTHCRMEDMQKSCCATPAAPSQVMQRSSCQSMLIELTGGAETTAKNLTEFETLSKRWLHEMSAGDPERAAGIVEPAYGEESFLSLLNWLVTDAGRARSFVTLTRGFGIALAKMKLTVWTREPIVKAAIRTITNMLGLEPEPCALPSRRIIRIAIDEELPGLCRSFHYLLPRALVLLALELGGGLRVGEATGGGEAHGLLANMCYVAEPIVQDEFRIQSMVVATLEDSKTTFGRTAVMCGVTRGELRLPCEQYLRDLWQASGLKVDDGEVRDGMRITRPDYWVVKVSFLGMDSDKFRSFIGDLEGCTVQSINYSVNYTIRTARTRMTSENDGEDKKYVNIAGGARESAEVRKAEAWAKARYPEYVNVVPGPLLRATDGKKVTHMPLQPGSTYGHLATSIKQAYFKSQAMEEKDVELDLCEQDPANPKFGNHWARRKADQVAQDTKTETKTEDETIDEGMGWNQKVRKKRMSTHYKGKTALMKLARITMML
jgi:hypothetical protein